MQNITVVNAAHVIHIRVARHVQQWSINGGCLISIGISLERKSELFIQAVIAPSQLVLMLREHKARTQLLAL